jgi:hypothetical protein
MSRLWMIVPAVLLAALIDDVPAASPDRKPPRLVAAAMVDADGDSRADRVRLTYSEKVRHPADRDGRYPFAVAGYRIQSVGKATGKTLAILLAEQAQPDPSAAPAIRYRRARSGQVKDRSGNQAVAQIFTKTKPHGRAPGPADADGDGSLDKDDCAPRDASIHPSAADVPDLAFVDSNCDGIDGTEKDAVFAAPNGNDQNPGTKGRPKREIQAAVQAAAEGKKPYVLVAFGSYARVVVTSSVSIYGGYDPSTWARRDRFPDGLSLIEGGPDAVFASDVKDVVLQHVSLKGVSGPGDRSVYGLRAVAGSSLTLQRVVVTAGNGTVGGQGADGQQGARGGNGGAGGPGSCDGNHGGPGARGFSPVGRTGGLGGFGASPGTEDSKDGDPGEPGKIGTAGGGGGAGGNPGKPGQSGDNGGFGRVGLSGSAGTSSTSQAEVSWVSGRGGSGSAGKPGNGGGGGGGGGSQRGTFINNGGGNGGGGGGGGGAGGTGGAGGSFGGGSFGIYLLGSKIVVELSSIRAGDGGAGGRGGDGGREGAGGRGGRGARVCTSEIGAGGNGGAGGAGGRGGGGGGGAGGPSVGIFKVGTSAATVKGSTVKAGTPGAGGAGGRSAPGGVGKNGEAGIAKAIFP